MKKAKFLKGYPHHDEWEITNENGTSYKTSVSKGTRPNISEKKKKKGKGKPVEKGSNQYKWGHGLFNQY